MCLEWKFSNWAVGDIGVAIRNEVSQLARENMRDLADMFPFRLAADVKAHFDNNWMVFTVSDRSLAGVPTGGLLDENELKTIKNKILPYIPRTHAELFELLGNEYFSFDKFTYVGPFKDNAASWQDVYQHVVEWLNNFVIPVILLQNHERVMRAIPQPIEFNLNAINEALWILECEETAKQGTAFELEGIGMITCQHVIGNNTYAFKAHNPSDKYPINIINANRTIDLAIIGVNSPLQSGLRLGSADNLNQMDHIAIAGFPNYRLGDTGVIIPGLISGFRPTSGIRRLLTNAPIIAGNSGGPVLGRDNCVVGVAVTGADRMEVAQDTENHGIIPIDALNYLRGY